MVNALSGSESLAPPPKPPRPLSDQQKALVSDTLANFDSESLSEEDAQSIVQAFKDAGIKPGRYLAEAVSELGFDAREIGELAGVERPERKGPPPPPLPSEGNLNTEGLQQLQDIMDDYDLSELSQEDEEKILDAFEDAGLIGEEGSLFSLTV